MAAQRRVPDSSPVVAPPVPIDEIIAKHAGKWVLMQVTAFGPSGWPIEGAVQATARSRKRATEILNEKLKSGELLEPDCLFQAIRHGKTVGELREILARPGIGTWMPDGQRISVQLSGCDLIERRPELSLRGAGAGLLGGGDVAIWGGRPVVHPPRQIATAGLRAASQ